MKQFFSLILTLFLFIFSFFYTNQCIKLLQNKDPLMKEIINQQTNYYQKPIDAIITNHTIIPGLKGLKIDTKKSYQKMKKLGYFNKNLLVYQTIPPKKTYLNTYNKVIIPKQTNKISLIFDINNQELFQIINQILNEHNIKGNLLNNTFSLTNSFFINTISTTYNKETDYCLTYNITINKECQDNKKYTILAKTTTINNYHLTTTKELILQNNLLIYNFNKDNITTLELIIKFLKNNHYTIVSIDELISE